MRIHVSIMTSAHSAKGYHAHRKGEQVDEGGWGEIILLMSMTSIILMIEAMRTHGL